jgi:fused signal recognition particle receptor
MGFFDKIKNGLKKTHDNIFAKVDKLVYGKTVIDDEFIDNIEEILLGADIGVNTTDIIMENLRRTVKEERYERPDQLIALLKEEIKKIFVSRESNNKPFKVDKKPHVILVVGVNGVGKTTSIGKLAYNYKNEGYSVLIGAADTFRAAANEQLETWANRAGVEIIQMESGSDPAAVVFNTLNAAISRNRDIVIIDTAGRLHNKANLMEELNKIARVGKKIIPDAPHEVLLVIDATTGQNGLNQAKEFTKIAGVTGIILTKLDGTAKGGIVARINDEMKIPVKFIGVGEQIDDLQVFDTKTFVEALLQD